MEFGELWDVGSSREAFFGISFFLGFLGFTKLGRVSWEASWGAPRKAAAEAQGALFVNISGVLGGNLTHWSDGDLFRVTCSKRKIWMSGCLLCLKKVYV